MADVRESAVRYLNVKPRTRKQVMQYLKRKGFEDGEIKDTVDELEARRYINDLDYSIMYFEYGFEKGRGISRIKRELAEKGVPTDIISAAFDELDDVPDQYSEAQNADRDRYGRTRLRRDAKAPGENRQEAGIARFFTGYSVQDNQRAAQIAGRSRTPDAASWRMPAGCITTSAAHRGNRRVSRAGGREGV